MHGFLARASVEVGIAKKAKSIETELTENYAALQVHYQRAYLGFVGNPCSKEAEEECRKASAQIRKREYSLRELEIKTVKLAKQIELRKKIKILCPRCGAEVSKSEKQLQAAVKKDKAGRRIQLQIGFYDCSQCKKTFRRVMKLGELQKKIPRVQFQKI